MYCCINPGGEELTSKERDIYSVSSCRKTRKKLLCPDFEGTSPDFDGAQRYKENPITADNVEGNLNVFEARVPHTFVAAMAYPFN